MVNVKNGKNKLSKVNNEEGVSIKLTKWLGTPQSIIIHTILFIGAFLLVFSGVDINRILLVLTTAVSLEAIYLALFIQMTVNRASESLEDVEENIDEIQEDVKELEENVDDIEENVGELTEDLDKIQEEEAKEEKEEEQQLFEERKTFQKIEDHLLKISRDMIEIQQEVKSLKNKYR